MRTVLPVLIAALTAALGNDVGSVQHHTPPATAKTTATAPEMLPFLSVEPPLAARSPMRAVSYEHRDHRELPVGTRIYDVNGFEMIVRPGQPGPVDRQPDVVVIPDVSVR
jgi:hypothetical protein